MKKILVVGYFGFQNFGDEWLLKVFIDKISKITNQPRQIFVLYNIEKTSIKENVVYIPRWKVYHVVRSVVSVDTIVFCGGLFQDETSIFSLLYYSFILFLGRILTKKILLLSTDFVIKKLPKIIQRSIILLSDRVLLRNSLEVQEVNHYFKNKMDKVKFCPDLCLFEDAQDKICTRKDIKTVALVLKFNMDKNLTRQMCECLSKKYNLVFIPFHLRQDYKFCLEIMNSLKNCELRVWDDVRNFKNIFSDVDLLISSRLHGIIIAMILQIPFVCVSTEEKIKRLMKSYFFKETVTLQELAQKNFNILDFIVHAEDKILMEYRQNLQSCFKFLVDQGLV